MVWMKIFNTVLGSWLMAIVSQKLLSRQLFAYKSFRNNRGILYGEIVLILFMNTIAKPHIKRLTVLYDMYVLLQYIQILDTNIDHGRIMQHFVRVRTS